MTTWIFQGSPDQFDVDTYLGRARQIVWTVRQAHLASEMARGDRVFLWRASGKARGVAGVIASGWLIGAPSVRGEDPVARDLWRVRQPRHALRVTIEVDRIATAKEIVQAKWLVNDPALSTLRILRLRSETNYRLTPEQAQRLESLWRCTGRDWNRADSIAGLWAYHQTYGSPISKSPGSPVATVAQRIGRAVPGVYNKVMNFRAIDERDQRQGLAAGGATDRVVWQEFYDLAMRAIRAQALEAEFEHLWPADALTEPESEPVERAITVTTGRKGQGYIVDPVVRRAVEQRAMKLAEDYYRQFCLEVQDTSTTRPFDLACRDAAGNEIHVEVKGSTGPLLEIQLTVGEVDNAHGSAWRTDLFLASGIRVTPGPEGPSVDGGEVRVITGWAPESDSLKPTMYRYAVPSA